MSIQPKSLNQDHDGEQCASSLFPIEWIARAAALPGKSFHVAIMLWYFSEKERDSNIQLTNKCLEKFSVDRNAKYRALGWLENAGLISISQKVGKTPVVTLLETGQIK